MFYDGRCRWPSRTVDPLKVKLATGGVKLNDFEILTLVFVVIGLVLEAMRHDDGNKKGRR